MPAITQAWTVDVAALLAAGAKIRAYCNRCPREWSEDLVAVRGWRGPGYSYLGRWGTCPQPGCGNVRVGYLATIPGVTNAINLSLFEPRLWIVELCAGTPGDPVLVRREFEAHQADQASRWGGRRRQEPDVWLARIRRSDDSHWAVFVEGDARRPWPKPGHFRTGKLEQDR